MAKRQHNPAHPKKRAVLAALRRGECVTDACGRAGVASSTHYRWTRADKPYAKAVKAAGKQRGNAEARGPAAGAPQAPGDAHAPGGPGSSAPGLGVPVDMVNEALLTLFGKYVEQLGDIMNPPRPAWLDDVKHKGKRSMLAALCRHGLVSTAAREAGVHRRRHYDWIEADAKYAAWAAAAEGEALERAEREADRRGVEGTLEPVVSDGRLVNFKRATSDALLKLRLQRLDPAHYRDKLDVRASLVDDRTGPQKATDILKNLRGGNGSARINVSERCG